MAVEDIVDEGLGLAGGEKLRGSEEVVVGGGDAVDSRGLEGAVEEGDRAVGETRDGAVEAVAVLLNDMERDEAEHLAVGDAVDADDARFGPVGLAQVAIGDVVGDDVAVAVDVADAEEHFGLLIGV